MAALRHPPLAPTSLQLTLYSPILSRATDWLSHLDSLLDQATDSPHRASGT